MEQEQDFSLNEVCGCKRWVREDIRRQKFHDLTKELPPLPNNANDDLWVWEEEDVDILRAAGAMRHGECPRTETLFCIAATGIRLFLSKQKRLTNYELD